MSEEKPPTTDVAVTVTEPRVSRPRLSVVGRDFSPISTLRPRVERKNPFIRHDHNVDLTVGDAIPYIANHPDIYQRNERLVDVLNGRIRDLTVPQLRERLTSAMTFMSQRGDAKTDKAKMVARVPSDAIVNALHQKGEWGARQLRGVTDTPLVRKDGTILQEPGYDVESKFVYQPSSPFPRIEDKPSKDECVHALYSVLAPIGEFPWKVVEDNKSPSLSAYISILLTTLLVGTIDGNIPGFAISANVRGTGKSKLTQIAAVIASGRIPATTPFAKDDEEVRKSIVGLLKKGRRVIMWDNVTRRICGDSIDMLLTTRLYEDRELGKSENPEYENNSVSIWTGNNLEAQGDTVRRIIPVDIESHDPNPENREFDFDPLEMTIRKRPEIVWALLTIIRGWYVDGCPRFPGVVLGSYENWSSIVPQVLVWMGLSNPILARKSSSVVIDRTLLETMDLASLWEIMEKVMQAEMGITIAQVIRLLYPERGEPVHPKSIELRYAMESVLGETGRDHVNRALAGRLRTARKRALTDKGKSFDIVGETHGNKRWSVRDR